MTAKPPAPPEPANPAAQVLLGQTALYLSKLATMADTIGARLDRMGGVLRCGSCRRAVPMKGSAEYLRHGWPKCCGATMIWADTKPLEKR